MEEIVLKDWKRTCASPGFLNFDMSIHKTEHPPFTVGNPHNTDGSPPTILMMSLHTTDGSPLPTTALIASPNRTDSIHPQYIP